MKAPASILLALFAFLASAAPGGAGVTPIPEKYGMVIINNVSESAGMAPVRFDHWIHRSRYTCRLCHIDVAFAMQANGTGITADMNRKGFYCGACHNGKTTCDDKPIFPACSLDPAGPQDKKTCSRCHCSGKPGDRFVDYVAFSRHYPKSAMDGLINWEEAELSNFLIDYLPGISVPRKPLKPQRDFLIVSKSAWMPDIIFSHRKHSVWNGCEVCHPEIFPSTKRGTVKYTMFDIAQGKYCGLCHGRVAFPLTYCDRCHRGRIPA